MLYSGDVVKANCGRDKDKIFLVIKTEGQTAFIADGKSRKTTCPKVKNFKHLDLIARGARIALAEKIKNGYPTSDRILRAAISDVQKNEEE